MLKSIVQGRFLMPFPPLFILYCLGACWLPCPGSLALRILMGCGSYTGTACTMLNQVQSSKLGPVHIREMHVSSFTGNSRIVSIGEYRVICISDGVYVIPFGSPNLASLRMMCLSKICKFDVHFCKMPELINYLILFIYLDSFSWV